MKTIALLITALACASLQAKDLGAHPVFKHYVGSWKAEGELKGEDTTLAIKEEWTGKAEGDNTFLIEGTRVINGDTQPFKWTVTYNEGADSYEAMLSGADASQTLRFEGHASEVTMTLELKAVTGNGESSITVVDGFAEGTKDVIESKVTFTGDIGQTTLEGTIKHERQKAR